MYFLGPLGRMKHLTQEGGVETIFHFNHGVQADLRNPVSAKSDWLESWYIAGTISKPRMKRHWIYHLLTLEFMKITLKGYAGST
ncbi:unnamed protein product [Clonostachys chloroleuca]|uniref:Uncharacterized protein n=1 Tax=Clonostachys chloroleuca TaxID=1926264 RepID=A0AA35PWS5_9HYPO|nr:unnamed protein product [Clonostachys chloroleuca]